MRKKVFLILTSLVLLIIFILVFLNFFVDHSESNKKEYEIKNSETIKKEKTKKEDDLIDDSQNDETNIEDYGDSNSGYDVSINKSNKNNMGTNNASHSNVVNNNSNNESNNSQTNSNSNQNNSNNYVTPTPAPEPVKKLTEWEKLGISEYDYYNTPSDNEGELAFKGSTSLCQNEINRLVNIYYDSGIDGGNYYTVNGKYTHSYLGCGIKMYMNGNAYTYSQIKSMGFN